MKQSFFSGTVSLLGFMLRRDLIRLTIWVLGISFFTILMAPYFADTYSTAEARQMMAISMENPAMVLLFGPVYSADNYHNGAMMSNFNLLFMGAIVAVMNIFLIARHTRQDEELGRMEVIRSLPTGRLANMTAVMLLGVVANLVMSLLIAFGITAFGIEDLGLNGSLSFAAALGAGGIFFAASTLLFCQLSSNNRTVLGISLGYMGATYLLRGIGDSYIPAGDSSMPALTVSSPFGLMHMCEAYVNNLWWPIILLLGVSALLILLAFRFGLLRDLGAGLIQAKPGPRNAGKLLSSPFGLSFRLLRGTAITWAFIILVNCTLFASMFSDLETFVGESETLTALFSGAEFTIIEEFLTLLAALISLMSAIPAISFMMKLRSEEKSLHTEHILSRSVSKNRLMASSYVLALAVPAILTALGAISLWAIASATVNDVPSLAVFFGASFSYLPAVWVMVGLSAALIGLLPKISGFIYGYLGYCFFALITVMMFGLPKLLESFSPFSYIPQVPLENANWGVTVILLVLAAILSVAGFWGHRKRDAVFY